MVAMLPVFGKMPPPGEASVAVICSNKPHFRL